MFKKLRTYTFVVMGLILLFGASPSRAQNSGTMEGVVKDQSGGVVPNATVQISDPVSGYQRTIVTGSDGAFRFTNIPFNTYHMVVTASGFAGYTQDVDVRSAVPVSAPVNLKIRGASISVTVEANGGDLVENDTTTHTDVDRNLFDKVPLESTSSSLSSLVTLTAPGVAADSNGLFHGFGDHASNSFSIDGQPITDQQSKVFSNQLPVDSVQSLEVIEGAPPAEYGGKTSLVIVATTRSGMGVTEPHGTITSSYGSFGTANGGFDLAYGRDKWGNFISANGLNTGRFLDGPEFVV
ncbi:MAG: carboxypeptidase-like regulatory domain-containing protein, partial [Candidatus Acidiferrales bacterium]